MVGKNLTHIIDRLWNDRAWRRCDISTTLDSGIRVEIKSRSDWDVFVEVFVAGEYDEAIRLALHHAQEADRQATIIDLGANVGFFLLRCLDIAKRHGQHPIPKILAVEGSHRVFAQLERQCGYNEINRESVALHHGLVGCRNGEAYIYESSYSCANTVVPSGGRRSRLTFRNAYASECRYLDLEAVIHQHDSIDLIKCDIEGSELTFLNNYPELVKRTRYLALEIHPQVCSLEACLRRVEALEFRRIKTVRNLPTAVHFLFERLPQKP
jgi:FkbM family methyltransferase